jgi:hypothetical protein
MSFEPLQPIVLSDEEQAAAADFIRRMSPPGERMAAREDVAAEMKRALESLAVLNLADRLTMEGRDEVDSIGACTSAVKAYALYPIATNCWECGRILAVNGRSDEARAMFEAFLRLSASEPSSPIRDVITKQHNVADLRSSAQQFLRTGVAPVYNVSQVTPDVLGLLESLDAPESQETSE